MIVTLSSKVTDFIPYFYRNMILVCGPGYRSRCNDFLQAGRSGDRVPLRAIFSAPVQTGPGSHIASCAMGTGSLSRG